MENTENSRTEGILYTLALLGALICQTYLQQNYFWTCYVIGVSMKTAVIGAVYQKVCSNFIQKIVNIWQIEIFP